jgi:hypothetical protein
MSSDSEIEAAGKIGIERNSTHLAGEYFVAAELYRRGFSVGLTMGNAKSIDLFAEKGGRTVNIQVKAIQSRKQTGWPMMRDRIRPDVFYVFVCLNRHDAPTYFVCTAEEARAKTMQYSTRGQVTRGAVNDEAFLGRWDKLERAASEPLGAPARP